MQLYKQPSAEIGDVWTFHLGVSISHQVFLFLIFCENYGSISYAMTTDPAVKGLCSCLKLPRAWATRE